MIIFVLLQFFTGAGAGGFYGKNEAFTLSLDFGKTVSPYLDIGTKLTMSWTGNAPWHYDIPFYHWRNPEDYPEEYFAEYKERNEVTAQFVARQYLNNLILIGSAGISMQEYITLPIQDSLGTLIMYPIGERDEYSFVFGAGMGIRIAKFDFCLTYSNRYGPLLYITREFGFKGKENGNSEKY